MDMKVLSPIWSLLNTIPNYIKKRQKYLTEKQENYPKNIPLLSSHQRIPSVLSLQLQTMPKIIK